MSQIETVSSLMSQYGLTETKATSDNDLDKDAFLNLLATQMKYQDPLNPQSNEDMLAQMAQFSALEQMQNMTTATSMQQAYDLLGKTIFGVVDTEVTGQVEYAEGIATAVTIKNGQPYLRVDGKDVALEDVEATVKSSSSLDNAFALVGKSVKGSVYNSDNESFETEEGFVTSAFMKDGIPYLIVNDKEMAVTNVSTVSSTQSDSQVELEDAIRNINETLESINDRLDSLSGE